MKKNTKKEILKILSMIAVLTLIIFAIFWFNSNGLEDKIEEKIQTSIEGKSIIDEKNTENVTEDKNNSSSD